MKLRTGKAASSVLDRSVYKRLGERYRPEENEINRRGIPGTGNSVSGPFHEPAAGRRATAGGTTEELTSTLVLHPVTRSGEKAGFLSVIAAANDLAGEGVCPAKAQTAVLLPPGSEESLLRGIEDQIREAAVLTGMKITGGWTEVTPAVGEPLVVTAAAGDSSVRWNRTPVDSTAQAAPEEYKIAALETGDTEQERTEPGPASEPESGSELNPLSGPWHVIIAGRVGLEGTCLIAGEKETELRQKFPGRFLNRVQQFWQELYVGAAAGTICTLDGRSHGAGDHPDGSIDQDRSGLQSSPEQEKRVVLTSASAGGIFAALWNFSERAGRYLHLHGFDIDLLKIPIAQETIEIADSFDLNPYELASAGSLIAAVQDPAPVVAALREQGIAAADAGVLTANHDRLLRNLDEVRYLDPPAPDALLQLPGDHDAQSHS